MKHTVSFSRGSTIAFLGSIYIVAFLLTPYWVLHTSTAAIIFYLSLTIVFGVLWVFLATSSLQFEVDAKDARSFLVLFVGMFLLNIRALNSVIPFRGDETLHIERTIEFMKRIPLAGSVVFIVLLGLFLFVGIKKLRWLALAAIVLVGSIVFFYLRSNPFDDVISTPAFYLRYPFFNYWFFAFLPRIVSVVGSPYYEFLYRVIPFLSMLGVAWFFQRKLTLSSPLTRIAWGLAAATTPIVFYYSSILYLEPPAVFLMTVACLDIRNLLHADSRGLAKLPAWYALILVGFFKETAVPLLACFVAVRVIVQITLRWKGGTTQGTGSWLSWLMREMGVAFVVLMPVFFYIHLRTSMLLETRRFVPQLSSLLDLTIYPIYARAFAEQFGIFLFFFIAGCIVLWRDRDFSSLFCYGAMIAAMVVFHVVDSKQYIGYSRFNLFILPPVLAGSARFIQWSASRKQVVAVALVFTAIATNLLLSPVHLDGVKTAYWGNYRLDTSEHYYPYQDALVWLKQNHPNDRILFVGLDFHYPFQFYWEKLGWKAKRAGKPSEGIADEQLAIATVLREAEAENYDVVVYRVLNQNIVPPAETGEFRLQVIQNSTHELFVFYKP